VLLDEYIRLYRTIVSIFTSKERYTKRNLSGVLNLRGMEELGKMEKRLFSE